MEAGEPLRKGDQVELGPDGRVRATPMSAKQTVQPSVARRWKLTKTVYDYSNETRWEGPDLGDDETVEVIELQPLLDLLEQAEETLTVPHVVHAFLSEHRRAGE